MKENHGVGDRCVRRPGTGKRPGSVRNGTLTEQTDKNPIPRAPATVGNAVGEEQVKSPGITSVSAVENGFSRDLLYYDGRLDGSSVRVLVDGGSMGNFVANDIVKK